MVNTTCAVRDCLSSSRINKNLKFHQIPHTEERCKIWIAACGRSDLIGKSSASLKNIYICNLHFEKHMYGKKSLKKIAIPTLHLPNKGTKSVQTQTDPVIILDDIVSDPTKQHIRKQQFPSRFNETASTLLRVSKTFQQKKSIDKNFKTNAKLRKRKLGKKMFKASKKVKLCIDNEYENEEEIEEPEYLHLIPLVQLSGSEDN